MCDTAEKTKKVTINSLVDICVRSGDLDRAYNLLKNPSLFPGVGGIGDRAGAVDDEAGVDTGAADMVDSPWREGADEDRNGGGDGRYEGEEATAEGEGGRSVAGAEATGGYGEGDGGAWRGVGLVRPSVEAFTSVLTGFAGVGDKDRALAVFQQVRQHGSNKCPCPSPSFMLTFQCRPFFSLAGLDNG